jgi:hypothetical protein
MMLPVVESAGAAGGRRWVEDGCQNWFKDDRFGHYSAGGSNLTLYDDSTWDVGQVGHGVVTPAPLPGCIFAILKIAFSAFQ